MPVSNDPAVIAAANALFLDASHFDQNLSAVQQQYWLTNYLNGFQTTLGLFVGDYIWVADHTITPADGDDVGGDDTFLNVDNF